MVPACESWPIATASYQTCACAPVTMPICFASRSRIGPCSICSSKYASAGKRRRRLGAAIADPVQRGPHRHALHVGQRIGLVEREHARPHARPHQRMAEAAALLVGPVHQFERRLGDDAEVVQRCASPPARPARPARRRTSRRWAGCRGGCRTAPAGGSDRGRRGGRTCCRSHRPARSARRPRIRRGTGRGRACPRRSGSAAARRPSASRRSRAMAIRLSHSRLPSMRWLVWAVMPGVLAWRAPHLARRAACCKTVAGTVDRGRHESDVDVGGGPRARRLQADRPDDLRALAGGDPGEDRRRRRRTRAPHCSPSATPRRTRTTRTCCATRCGRRRRARPGCNTT